MEAETPARKAVAVLEPTDALTCKPTRSATSPRCCTPPDAATRRPPSLEQALERYRRKKNLSRGDAGARAPGRAARSARVPVSLRPARRVDAGQGTAMLRDSGRWQEGQRTSMDRTTMQASDDSARNLAGFLWLLLEEGVLLLLAYLRSSSISLCRHSAARLALQPPFSARGRTGLTRSANASPSAPAGQAPGFAPAPDDLLHAFIRPDRPSQPYPDPCGAVMCLVPNARRSSMVVTTASSAPKRACLPSSRRATGRALPID